MDAGELADESLRRGAGGWLEASSPLRRRSGSFWAMRRVLPPKAKPVCEVSVEVRVNWQWTYLGCCRDDSSDCYWRSELDEGEVELLLS